MKVCVDHDKCAGLGVCESIAPEYFEVNDDGDLEILKADIDADDLADIEDAVSSCPTEALRIEQ